jgi:predicted small integral membrane protein
MLTLAQASVYLAWIQQVEMFNVEAHRGRVWIHAKHFLFSSTIELLARLLALLASFYFCCIAEFLSGLKVWEGTFDPSVYAWLGPSKRNVTRFFTLRDARGAGRIVLTLHSTPITYQTLRSHPKRYPPWLPFLHLHLYDHRHNGGMGQKSAQEL